ncbi:MAG: acyl-CoA dehydrogenase family protein [Myxococcota bacterium]
MRSLFGPEEQAFRQDVRAFLADWSDLDAFLCHGPVWPRVAELFRALGERGWLALAWPKAHGGLGLAASYEYVLWDEIAYARAARNPLLTIVARTLLRAGSDAQRAEWLPRIRAGAVHFALGYSEPEAGSDLASLRTRAVRRGDVYVVDGEKCWQSYAGHVEYLWLLARTGEPGSRGGGLSLFIVDRETPGLTVNPLPTLDGDALFECHFAGVEVPAERRVGPENGAWKLMADALADERHIQFPAGRLHRDLDEVVAWLRASGRADDPVVRRELAALRARVRSAEVLALRVVELTEAGRSTVVEAAAVKVFHTELCQEIARRAFAWGGAETLVTGHRVQQLWRQSLWETIGGGTSEVMRGIVARQGLGLGGRS